AAAGGRNPAGPATAAAGVKPPEAPATATAASGSNKIFTQKDTKSSSKDSQSSFGSKLKSLKDRIMRKDK
ncbi:unnamed protein product, partial [Didymodactylos carnosus]